MIDGKFCVRKAFENIRRASLNMEKRKNEENQRKQKQKNDEEYEKTVKLLDLINRNKKREWLSDPIWDDITRSLYRASTSG